MRSSDWSSEVCSSDLTVELAADGIDDGGLRPGDAGEEAQKGCADDCAGELGGHGGRLRQEYAAGLYANSGAYGRRGLKPRRAPRRCGSPWPDRTSTRLNSRQ